MSSNNLFKKLKTNKKVFFYLLLIGHSFVLNALEIDEKLTLRILKLSNSKKTALVNRGGEDGLIVGDHAKFFTTTGVIARGVIEKVSPSRSIWSIYRIIEADELIENKVMNLKIATPVKITTDSSKSLKEESEGDGTEKMSIDEKNNSSENEDASEKSLKSNQDEMEEMKVSKNINVDEIDLKPEKDSKNKRMGQSEVDISYDYNKKIKKTWEMYSNFSLNALSGTVSGDSTSNSASSASAKNYEFLLGIEKSFFDTNGFFKDISITGFVSKRYIENGDSPLVTGIWTYLGGGFSYSFYNHNQDVLKPIGLLSIVGGQGSASIQSNTTIASVSTPTNMDGQATFIAIGGGGKYNFNQDYTMRLILDYVVSPESYTFTGGGVAKHNLSGPRIQFGLGFRIF
jgi:hypothetical protein